MIAAIQMSSNSSREGRFAFSFVDDMVCFQSCSSKINGGYQCSGVKAIVVSLGGKQKIKSAVKIFYSYHQKYYNIVSTIDQIF